MPSRPEIETLIRQVAHRHDGFLARRVATTCLIAASGLAIALSLIWVLRGHAVPLVVLLAVALSAVASGIGWWWVRRMKTPQAVREADRFFGLRDGIASARHLAETLPDDSATELQWKWLSPRLAECRVEAITRPFPKRPAVLGVFLLAAAVWLGLLPPSPAVRAAGRQALETRERVKESKEELEKLVEELEKDSTSPEEKDALRMDEFRKLVKKIDETGDRTEVARQFARIEQKLRDTSHALEQKRDEETLKLAASELAKAEETEARQVGKKLEAKELAEAADLLEKLAAKKAEALDKKDPAVKKKEMAEAREELAKLRAASKRMAAAGKQRKAGGQAQGGAAGSTSESLEDMLDDLDNNASDAEKNLADMEIDPNAKFDPRFMQRANGTLNKLGKYMRGMNGRRLAMSKLDRLRMGLSQAQCFTQGQTQSLAMGQNPGGKQPGVGSSWNERKERDDSQKNGSLAQLQGQHGAGPSMSSVEDAESGTGVSGRRGEAKQQEFARQVESFVQREDVPESLKLGVRNYFENLQSATPDTAAPKTSE